MKKVTIPWEFIEYYDKTYYWDIRSPVVFRLSNLINLSLEFLTKRKRRIIQTDG